VKNGGRKVRGKRNKQNGGEQMDTIGIFFNAPAGFRDAARRFAEEHGLSMRELATVGLLAQMENGQPARIDGLKKRIEAFCGQQEAAA
jgi:hypothetical protein